MDAPPPPPKAPFFSEELAALLNESKRGLRDNLKRVDEHPIGHIAAEIGRSWYKDEKITLTKFLELVDVGEEKPTELLRDLLRDVMSRKK